MNLIVFYEHGSPQFHGHEIYDKSMNGDLL